MICTPISFYTKQNENEFVIRNAFCFLPLGNLVSNILKGGRIIKDVFFQFCSDVDTENYLLPSINEGIQWFSHSPLLISHYCRMTRYYHIMCLLLF